MRKPAVFRGPKTLVRGLLYLLTALAALLSADSSLAQVQSQRPTRRLITESVNDSKTVTLAGNMRPEATAQNDMGPVANDLAMQHMQLQLRLPAEKEQELEQLIRDQQDPSSPKFHKWLTSDQFKQQFSVAPEDVETITSWLKMHGFTVEVIYARSIDFSGTAGQVENAFRTEIHSLKVKDEVHIANMSDPKIPEALAPVVAGVIGLHNFMPRPMNRQRSQFTIGDGLFAVVPADLATIYNVNPLFAKGISGQGQTIVVVEDSDVFSTSDISTFRSVLGLSGYTSGSFTQVHPAPGSGGNCTDPGPTGDDAEATLDVEWSSAGAPNASIVLASCANTSSSGVFIALINILTNGGPTPAIISISYGESETELGAAANGFISSLFQQAAAEGVSIFVASADQAAAVSDRGADTASHGINVNGEASTPYNVAVGGTDFGDTFAGTNNTYWSATNSATFGSALSYVPEIPWNDSCASVLISTRVTGSGTTYGTSGFCNNSPGSSSFLEVAGGSGGPSGCATGAPSSAGIVGGTCAGYTKPSWQSVFGNPSDGVRDTPDVSLFAANGVWGHYYVVCYSDTGQGGSVCTGTPDTWSGFGGTSVATPIMAAFQALVNQSTGTTWGNPNPTYYALADAEYGASGSTICNSTLGNGVASTCVFYDVTQGDMDVPCTGTVNCYLPSGTNGVLSTGPVGTLTVTAGGTGYTSVPACTLSAPSNQGAYSTYTGGVQATCTATLTAKVVTGLTITNGGAGYAGNPICTLTGGAGTGATCTAATGLSAAYQPAFGTTPGWDFATGIGTVNTSNLVSQWPSTNTITVTSGSSQSATVLTAFTNKLVATVKTTGGVAVSGAVVTFTPPSTGASITFAGGVNTATTNASGVATSAAITANAIAGTSYNVLATTPGANANNFTLTNNPGPAAKLGFITQPSTVAVNSSITPPVQVAVQDAEGNTVPSATTSIAIAIGTNPSGGTLSGTTPVPAANGVATFSNLSINKVGTGYTLTANGGGFAQTSAAFNVTAGAPAQLAFTVEPPASVSAGASIAPPVQVSVEDALGNVVTSVPATPIIVAIGTNPSAGTLSGTLTVNTVSGVAAFPGLSINNTGVGYTLTSNGGGLPQATSTAFTVTAATNPVPTTTSLSPTSANAGAGAFTLTVNGTNFIASSVVNFNGAAKSTTFVSATQLTAAITPADIVTGGTVNVTVTNAAPGGGTSNAQSFTINNLAPTLTSISPTSATAGGIQFTLTLTGTNFVSTSVVNFNGAVQSTTFVSPTQLTATITAAEILTAGTPSVTVTNPAPGGGTSTAQTFTINNPAPTITTLSPTGTTVGGPAFTLTVNGTGFVSTSQVKFNGTARATTFVSSTQVTAAILATDIATVGTPPVTVINPAPGGGTSGSVNFNISAAPNPVPTLTGISPANAILNQPVTLVLTGTNFIASSIVNFGAFMDTGGAVTNGGTALTINIPGAQLAAAGNINVTVTNPAPGGGTSAIQVFQIFNPVPSITSFAPPSAIAGSAGFSLTVNGTNFINGAVVDFNGSNVTTTFVSSTQIMAAIPASALVNPGTAVVSVQNPAPTAGSSPTVDFQINNPVPTATSISPTSATEGGPQFTLTVNGTNFIHNSSVLFNGGIQTTTFVSATQLTATIPASAILTAGTVNVAVTNPAPGGGTSGNLSFTINNPAPTITTLSPTSANVGSGLFTLSVTGTGFVNGAVVNFNGNAKATTFINSTAITASITATDIATAGSFPVTVTNPAPGGGTSTAVNFTVTNPVPATTSISPTNATAGGPAFSLVVTGSNFVSTSVVKFNGVAQATTFNSATQLTASITIADIAAAGTFPVTVTNAAPGGGTSTPAINFSVTNPPPVITTLSPNNATAGSTGFTLTVTGSGFVSGAAVNFNGVAATTTFVSATQLTASIPAGDIATAGIVPVTVTNPAPGGGTSTAVNFTVNNPAPTITSLNPTGIVAGGAAFPLTVNGTGFVSSSVVKFNGNAKATTFVSSTQITAAILATDIATSGNANITVTNSAPGGGTTSNFVFMITTAPNPAPTLTAIAPTTTTAGGPAFTLMLTGTGFVAGTVVNFNGVAQATTVTSGTQLMASITAADIATAGSFPITVFNPAPGGGTSTAINLAVNNPAPAITTLSPTGALAGGPAFTLTVNGSGFVSTSAVSFNGNAKATTFVSSTQLTAAILAADIAALGTFPVKVTNPAPGGGASTAVNFAVTNPPPIITTISPTSATAGGLQFTLTINGSAFVNGATVSFNGNAAATTFVSATQLTALITAADITTAGTVSVTVANPAPGGGTSAPAAFTINNPSPTLTTISPTFATAGGPAFTLTLTGTNIVNGSVVSFNNKAEATTFVSATQITAAINAVDIAAAGTLSVIVTNPAPGGGTSTAATFTVNNPVPAITTLSPTSAVAGGNTFTLTVNGSNFVSGSTVNFNGTAATTTFVSATQIAAAIPAAQITTSGVVNVTVKNPAPGGGTSNAVQFTISNPPPTITTISPTSATAGGPAFTLTVNGTNFAATSVVNFNGAVAATTFKSATQLTASILPAQILAAGLVNVTVITPAPGGGTSTAVQFTINNAQPTLTSLSPASTLVGNPTFTLTINGNGFVNGATVAFNSAPVTATFVNSTQLTVPIPATAIVKAGLFNVIVTNPPPSIGPSLALTFTVNNPVPTLTSLGQTHVAAGTAFTLTVNGTNFNSTSAVNFGTKAETTTLVSATQITAAIPASDVATAGPVTVTVVNPAPGGGPTPTSISFTLDGYTIAGPGAPVVVKAGVTAVIPITITPSANGFANPVVFSVTGLPKDAALTPLTVTPGLTKSTVNLMITSVASSSAPPSSPMDRPLPPTVRFLLVSWLAALLAGIYAAILIRRTPRLRRYAVLVPLALLLISGGVLAGCSSLSMKGTPTGSYPLSVTATSGTFAQSTPAGSVTLTVQ